ncbi:MAG: EamA family transporter, partial [Luteolibacter sp.]
MAREITEYLRETIARGGSDLHLSAWAPACARVNGSIVSLDQELLDPTTVRNLILDTLSPGIAVVLSVFFLGERPTIWQASGIAITLVGVGWVMRGHAA